MLFPNFIGMAGCRLVRVDAMSRRPMKRIRAGDEGFRTAKLSRNDHLYQTPPQASPVRLSKDDSAISVMYGPDRVAATIRSRSM